ncbi:unnamed protein product [Miscanthus lutarioriparius]|uniref:Uncharacterized protein n=1 Tax=Miscanthus lutarioriparius TaxID=422564 RepID=A0A811R1N2_9POAL|nr:unnamed protein product [Miscanthus lutarioriparius]
MAIAESCVDAVVMEMVAVYCGGLYAAKPELAARRIEAIGFQVGHQLSERYTMERPRFSDHLEAIKFICKDFWSELFKKQIDNLKTNHRGTFVLQDNRFRWLTCVSLDPYTENTDSTENDSAALGDTAAQTTTMLLYFPCGLIRGALTNLGIPCSVSADMSNLPAYLVCSMPVTIIDSLPKSASPVLVPMEAWTIIFGYYRSVLPSTHLSTFFWFCGSTIRSAFMLFLDYF